MTVLDQYPWHRLLSLRLSAILTHRPLQSTHKRRIDELLQPSRPCRRKVCRANPRAPTFLNQIALCFSSFLRSLVDPLFLFLYGPSAAKKNFHERLTDRHFCKLLPGYPMEAYAQGSMDVHHHQYPQQQPTCMDGHYHHYNQQGAPPPPPPPPMGNPYAQPYGYAPPQSYPPYAQPPPPPPPRNGGPSCLQGWYVLVRLFKAKRCNGQVVLYSFFCVEKVDGQAVEPPTRPPDCQ
jgi:hypothetical protein